MAENIALEVQGILIEAWNKFFNEYYNKLAPKYSRLWGLNKKEAEESHWICWNEYDLMFHIGRLFYNILSDKKEAKSPGFRVCVPKVGLNYTTWYDELGWGTEGARRATAVPRQGAEKGRYHEYDRQEPTC